MIPQKLREDLRLDIEEREKLLDLDLTGLSNVGLGLEEVEHRLASYVGLLLNELESAEAQIRTMKPLLEGMVERTHEQYLASGGEEIAFSRFMDEPHDGNKRPMLDASKEAWRILKQCR